MSWMRTPSREAAARSIDDIDLQAALLAVGRDIDQPGRSAASRSSTRGAHSQQLVEVRRPTA